MDYRTIKIWHASYHKLRLLAALTGERLLVVLDRLITAELERVQHQ